MKVPLYKTPHEFFRKTDWELLLKQKEVLLKISYSQKVSDEEIGLLGGLIEFLSFAGDLAEEMNLWKYPTEEEEK